MNLGELKALIEASYGWALGVDYEDRRQRHLFWYRSAEKDEPRLGERFSEPGAERELPLGIGLMADALHRELAGLPVDQFSRSVGEFLLERPRWRGILRRIQSLAPLPYAEIRDNLLRESCLPVDLLGCKLTILSAAKFDRGSRWTRITLYQGAPVIQGAPTLVTTGPSSFPIAGGPIDAMISIYRSPLSPDSGVGYSDRAREM
jgi:hypothetical protein